MGSEGWADGGTEGWQDGGSEGWQDGSGWDNNPLCLREGPASETRLELPGLVPERSLGTYCACICQRIAVWKDGRMEEVKK